MTDRDFIITGGIGAGKTKLIDRIVNENPSLVWVIGSPATTMKRYLSKVIARTYNKDGTQYGWEKYFEEMLDRRAKEKYRGILQGYGEHFSNVDNFFWANRMMNEVLEELFDLSASSERKIGGTLYDSVRRPPEIIAIRQVYPDAVHVHLDVSYTRQMEFLTAHLGNAPEKAAATLAHSSEHWLDGMAGTDYDADFTIEADYGDEYVWNEFRSKIWMQ